MEVAGLGHTSDNQKLRFPKLLPNDSSCSQQYIYSFDFTDIPYRCDQEPTPAEPGRGSHHLVSTQRGSTVQIETVMQSSYTLRGEVVLEHSYVAHRFGYGQNHVELRSQKAIRHIVLRRPKDTHISAA